MKVMHFIDTLNLGGAETMLLDLVEHQRRRGEDAWVVHFGNREVEAACVARELPAIRAPRHRDFKSFRRLTLFARAFRRFLREERVDLLHSHLFGAITGAALAARSARIPHIGTLHDTHMVAEDPRRMWLLRAASWMGTKLVAVSLEAAVFYRALGGLRGDDPIVIRNGVALPLRSPSLVREEDVHFISVGRLVPLKGFDRLIRAFAALPAYIRERSRLSIVGEGPEREALEGLARSLGMTRIRFLGLRRDVPALLSESDAFVLASETEALSRSILEAMAAGLPCIATDVGGNHELIRDGESGLLVPLDNEQALTDALARIARSPAERHRMGAAGAERVKAELSLDACVDRYLRLYRDPH